MNLKIKNNRYKPEKPLIKKLKRVVQIEKSQSQKKNESIDRIKKQIEDITNNRDYSWVKQLQPGDIFYITHTNLFTEFYTNDFKIFNSTPIKLIETPLYFQGLVRNSNTTLNTMNLSGAYDAGTGFTVVNSTPQGFIIDQEIQSICRQNAIEEKLYIFWQDPRVVEALKQKGRGNATIERKEFKIDSSHSQDDWYIISKKQLTYDPKTGVSEID